MKKVVFIVICIITIIFTDFNVYAKDTVYSINKYEEEKFNFIIDSYNEKGEKDGLITAGKVSLGVVDSSNDFEDIKVILVKYDYKGEIIWQLPYGKVCQNTIDYLEYTYDENGNINGYLIVMPKTYDITTSDEDNSGQETFIKVDLNGKVEWEKDNSSEEIISITKIIPTHNSENKTDGYIAIAATRNDDALLIKYDLDLNIVWTKKSLKDDAEQVKYIDIETIYENNNLVGYSIIREIIKNDNIKQVELLRVNTDGEDESIINQDLNKYISYKLVKAIDGIILYGLTDEVKLKKGDISYYIIKYNINSEEEWETIGEDSIEKDSSLVINAVENSDNEIEKYLIMYNTKDSDISTEVAEINLDGLFVKKIKKIASSYYTIESFNITGNILYFIGQINCPADDDCQYNKSSLFLISDEDKVIEVKDNTSRNILLVIMFITVITAIVIYIKRKRIKA